MQYILTFLSAIKQNSSTMGIDAANKLFIGKENHKLYLILHKSAAFQHNGNGNYNSFSLPNAYVFYIYLELKKRNSRRQAHINYLFFISHLGFPL